MALSLAAATHFSRRRVSENRVKRSHRRRGAHRPCVSKAVSCELVGVPAHPLCGGGSVGSAKKRHSHSRLLFCSVLWSCTSAARPLDLLSQVSCLLPQFSNNTRPSSECPVKARWTFPTSFFRPQFCLFSAPNGCAPRKTVSTETHTRHVKKVL
jgi:hypothetical protein